MPPVREEAVKRLHGRNIQMKLRIKELESVVENQKKTINEKEIREADKSKQR